MSTLVYQAAAPPMVTAPKVGFRNYKNSAHQARVEKFYAEQHAKQTFDSVRAMEKRHLQFNKVKMGAWEAIEYLDKVVDSSDPDTALTQIQHALQSAEAARKLYPDIDWLHLVGLIHDLGKLLAVTDPERNLVGDPQWAVVGDTFPVGCKFETTNVLCESFAHNPDNAHPVYSTPLGVYKPNCGLDNVKMSWGHDEYLYQVLVHNGAMLPPPALAIIRYHSFYPWHTQNGYCHLTNAHDEEMKKWVLVFNQCDLYSKADETCDVNALKPYYQALIKKYLPEVIQW
ncbi:Inositol oxygenase [Plasmodiophora brassicae]|uniref:Inositol oxygenase n=1 Tax=Plasmodiophora brassicae TaxID=37360 RepID=A0A0G4J3H3_PLABS|nr:hypothetical protein PBRA_002418 [Plasmodiophora brassicae]SPQ93656.1 unnamed protein product [Plasmodiophora brassicae]